jgi:HSP20 family molecular chaperone IbpA
MIYTTMDTRRTLNILDEILNATLDFTDNATFNKTCSSKNFIKKEKDKVVFRAPATGLQKEEIKMSFDNKHLLVVGKPSKINDPIARPIDHKVFIGDAIDSNSIKASLDSGILTIVIPFKEKKDTVSITF